MKTMSFFNEKGGSGKSTFTLMMASWLRYKCGARVAVFDLDAPMFSISELRAADLEAYSSGNRELMKFLSEGCDPRSDWYPIETAPVDGMGRQDQDDMASYILSYEDELDYVFIDFGGSFIEGDTVVSFLRRRILDLVIIPVYTDPTVLLSAMELLHRTTSMGQRSCVFWNRVTRSERPQKERNRLEPLSALLRREGAHVLKTLIPDLTIFRRDSRTWRFVRTTACWPQSNVDIMCPSLEGLFSEIKTEIDSI